VTQKLPPKTLRSTEALLDNAGPAQFYAGLNPVLNGIWTGIELFLHTVAQVLFLGFAQKSQADEVRPADIIFLSKKQNCPGDDLLAASIARKFGKKRNAESYEELCS